MDLVTVTLHQAVDDLREMLLELHPEELTNARAPAIAGFVLVGVAGVIGRARMLSMISVALGAWLIVIPFALGYGGDGHSVGAEPPNARRDQQCDLRELTGSDGVHRDSEESNH
jgi:hypothetical protein